MNYIYFEFLLYLFEFIFNHKYNNFNLNHNYDNYDYHN